MSDAQKHKIKSLEDLFDLITPENVFRLSEDLRQWMLLYSICVGVYRQNNPDSAEGLKNSQIVPPSFTWIDDGETGLKDFQKQKPKNK